jgi:hypothetical protein
MRWFHRSFGQDIEKCTKLGNSDTQNARRNAGFHLIGQKKRIRIVRQNCLAQAAPPNRNVRRDRGIVKKENQVAKSKPDDTESIVRKFQKIHGGTFDYSKVDYFNHTTKVIIICRPSRAI